MLVRYGFIILVLLFGLLTFVAGLTAPPAVKETVQQLGTALLSIAVSDAEKKAGDKAAAAGDKAVGDAAKKADAKKGPAPIPFAAFERSPDTPPPYGLQAGLFPDQAAAEATLSALKKNDVPGVVHKVQAGNGLIWFLVAAGPYKDMVKAGQGRAAIQRLLGHGHDLPPINWVPAKATAPAPASG